METIRFWYTFEDENKEMADTDVEISVSKADGVHLQDVCDSFVSFLRAVGYSTDGLAKYFPKELDWE